MRISSVESLSSITVFLDFVKGVLEVTESSENEVLEDVSLDIVPQENLELNVTEMQPKNCSEKVHSYIGDVVEEKVNEVCTVNLFS